MWGTPEGMTVHILNPQPDLGTASLVPPPPYGYLLFGAAVAPPSGPPFVLKNGPRDALIAAITPHLAEIRKHRAVVRATGYRAVLMPPARPPAFAPGLEPPRFDVSVLIETKSPDDLADIGGSDSVAALRSLLSDAAERVEERRARCIKAIADVEKRATGTYLFNYWVAADRDTAAEVFDHLAPWYQKNTGLTNSTVLQPLDDEVIAFVNHARWDAGLWSIMLHQLRPSFFSFVRPNLTANDVQVYPALYRRF